MSSVLQVARWRWIQIVSAGLLAVAVAVPSAAADRGASQARAKAAERPAVTRAKAATPRNARLSASQPATARGVRESRVVVRGGKVVRTAYAPRIVEAPPRMSIGQAIGLHLVDDPLDLRSSVAMVIDQQSGETLFSKNAEAVLPIASITKVMTAMIVLDAGLPLNEVLDITEADRDTERHSGSRLPIGSRLTRAEMLQLALMSSENRAAHALGRNFPGGVRAFVAAMNAKADAIGMSDSRFGDPTGLSSSNVSNARDLARLVRAAHAYPLIRQYSTATELNVDTGHRQVSFRSTNRLVDDADWNIGLQKTGYISEAGKCLVMQAKVGGRAVIMVLLDATATTARFSDAQRLRKWVEQMPRESRTVAATS